MFVNCHACKRVFECMQESNPLIMQSEYKILLISNVSDSGICPNTHKTGMTVFMGMPKMCIIVSYMGNVKQLFLL